MEPKLDLYEAIRTTRAVRKLRPDPIPEDALRRVLEAATYAPSGGNRQPWRIVAVTDPGKKKVMRDLYRGPWQAYRKSHASELAKLPDDVRGKFEKLYGAGDYLADHLHEAPVICVFCFEPSGLAIVDRDFERPSVVGGGSLYPAVQNLLLACRAEGLGCCLTTLLVSQEPRIRELIELPEPWATYAHVPIGYPVGRGHGPLSRRPVDGVVDRDRFGTPFFA